MKRAGRTPEIRARRKRVAKLFPTTTYDKMAEKLGVPRSVIESDTRSLGLMKTREQKAAARGLAGWDDAHIEILRLMRPVMTIQEVASLLGRSRLSVEKKAFYLGLKRGPQARSAPPKAQAAALAPKEPVAKPVTPPAYRGPPPMTAAQRVTHEKLRITYAPDKLPWKARRMFEPMSGIPDLSYRGQVARN